MNTYQQKFEELLGILGLEYIVRKQSKQEAIITSSMEVEHPLYLKLEDETITVYTEGEFMDVLPIEKDMHIGKTVSDIEKILIRYEHLEREPLALSVYLYCRLLGILWGLKADEKIRDKDPVANNIAIIYLTCLENGKHIVYEYMIDIYGNIIVEKPGDSIRFHPNAYLKDPEKMISAFFNFFKNVDRIISAGKG